MGIDPQGDVGAAVPQALGYIMYGHTRREQRQCIGAVSSVRARLPLVRP